MAKKTEAKKVMVEMTEEQKDKVATILADEPAKAAPKKMMQVELRFTHYRNNQEYGPGLVTVPADLGASMFAADYNAYMSRLREMESKNNNVQILSKGVTIMRPVPNEG